MGPVLAGDLAQHPGGGGGEPGVDALERHPVGLVVGVGRRPRRRGQRHQLGRGLHEADRHRQLDPQVVDLAQVAAEGGGGLAGDGLLQRLGGHERVAVAVAAHPRPHPHQGLVEQLAVGPRRPATARPARADGLVQRRDHLEERQVVVLQALGDLVAQPQPRQPQQRRLPQGQHRPPQVAVPLRQLVGVELAAVAAPHQLGDPPLHLEDRLAPHLGGVRGDDRADEGAAQHVGHLVAAEAGGVEPLEGAGRGCPSRGGEPMRRWYRRRRSACRSSARLASSEKWLNARTTWRALRWSRPLRWATRASAGAPSRFTRRASTRVASTSSKTSSPAWSRMTSPRTRPSRRMSARRRASSPLDPVAVRPPGGGEDEGRGAAAPARPSVPSVTSTTRAVSHAPRRA